MIYVYGAFGVLFLVTAVVAWNDHAFSLACCAMAVAQGAHVRLCLIEENRKEQTQ